MAQNSPGPPGRKLGLIAPISIAVVIGLIVAGAYLMQRRGDKPAPTDVAPAEPPAAPAPLAPAAPPLGRQELIEAANAAAAAYAAGGAGVPRGKDPWVGRSFSIRIPFGCEGPQTGAGADQAFYEFDPERRTVKLVARPTDWSELPLVRAQPSSQIEAVEGFWIRRPWAYSDGCGRRSDAPAAALPTPPAAQTLGLARLFERGGSRVERRGRRAYEQVVKLGEGEAPAASGYRLTLEGRLASFPDGRAIRCWSKSPDHRPICLFAADLERVAFEASEGGRVLSEWRE